MRPIRKNTKPATCRYSHYRDAQPCLVSRIGIYCSYCERKIPTLLAVEHIKPKKHYPSLELDWSNFLLSCVNCNSTKGESDENFDGILLPDRDNTFVAYEYKSDGKIVVSHSARTSGVLSQAARLLKLVGLNKKIREYRDENGKLVARDRLSQRIEAWGVAQRAKSHFQSQPSDNMKEIIVELALQTGFFSIWMTVFSDDTDMKNRLIDAFPGTRDSGCFDASGNPISPAPNPDGLLNGGKI